MSLWCWACLKCPLPLFCRRQCLTRLWMYHGPFTYAETAVGLCPTPTGLQKMLIRTEDCVGRQEGQKA